MFVSTSNPLPPNRRKYLQLLRLSNLGLEMGIAVLGGLWLGNKLDNRWDTAPWLLLTGIALGMAIAMYSAWRTLKKVQQTNDLDER